MKLRYHKRMKSGDFMNGYFTDNEEYEVIADYRLRESGQAIRDNGFVIIDDWSTTRMVFLGDFEISCSDLASTFVFKGAK